MSVYVIAIGGTGAKFAEAVAHLAAAGFYSKGDYSEKIEILFVDPDKGNGNLKASDGTVKVYQKCAETIDRGINKNLDWWMQTEVNLFQGGLWSPFKVQDKFRLRDVFKYDDYDDDDKKSIRHLFDVLYTPEERDLDLKEGFRGRPAVGAAVMTQLRQQKKAGDSWDKLVQKILADYHADPGNPPKVFLCGSIFGGTGASGFPTLGRLITNELQGEAKGNILNKIKLGGLLMLPYFRFSSYGQDEKETVYARAEEFILKTEAALRYYGTQDLKFDAVYLLGMPTMTNVENFSTGGGTQRNQPHILELYAGLALRDFIFTEKPEERQVILLNRKQSNMISWDDLPDKDETRKKLIDAARFAYLWVSVIVPDLEHARTKLREVNFAVRFYDSTSIKESSEWDQINAIKDWSESYLKWLGVLHENGSGLNWLNTPSFFNRGKLSLDQQQFSNLVKTKGDIDAARLLTQLNNRDIQGVSKNTTGLAKALYRVLSEKSV
jgi:hypothetical protein